MGMVVRTNTMSTNAYRQLGMNNASVAKSLEKLSSGFRINRAGDDASGLAISEKMKAQIKGLEQASANAQDGISLVQTAEGALTEVHNMLNRMVELATKSANGTIQDEVDRDAIQTEVDALTKEITRISKSTDFNGIKLLDGSLGAVAKQTNVAASGTPAGFTAGTATPDTADVLAAVDFSSLGDNLASGDVTALTTGSLTVGDLTVDLTSLTLTTANTFQEALDAIVGAVQSAATAANTAGAGGTSNYNAYSAISAADNSGTGLTISFTETAQTYAAGTGTAAYSTLDYTGKEGKDVIGTTLTVGTTVYEFVKTGGAATGTNTAITVAEDAVAADIVDALAAGIGATATDNGDTIDIEAASVKQAGGGLTLQVGATNDDFNKVTVSVEDLSAEGLGIDTLQVDSAETAGEAIKTIKDAINTVSTNRGNLGALQNRLEYAINNLDTTAENMSSANSRIRDTDMAKEMMNYTKMNILTQAAQAMLAQANQQPQSILQLLQ